MCLYNFKMDPKNLWCHSLPISEEVMISRRSLPPITSKLTENGMWLLNDVIFVLGRIARRA